MRRSGRPKPTIPAKAALAQATGEEQETHDNKKAECEDIIDKILGKHKQVTDEISDLDNASEVIG